MEFKGFMEKIMQYTKKTQEVVVQKSGEVAKMTKLKMAIVSAEGKIKDAYTTIGRIVYEAYRDDEGDSDAIESKCKELDELYAELAQLKADYSVVRNMKRCEACGTENAAEATYCSKCGAVLAQKVDEMPESKKEEEVVEVETTEE